jgi:hypothetical protein
VIPTDRKFSIAGMTAIAPLIADETENCAEVVECSGAKPN